LLDVDDRELATGRTDAHAVAVGDVVLANNYEMVALGCRAVTIRTVELNFLNRIGRHELQERSLLVVIGGPLIAEAGMARGAEEGDSQAVGAVAVSDGDGVCVEIADLES